MHEGKKVLKVVEKELHLEEEKKIGEGQTKRYPCKLGAADVKCQENPPDFEATRGTSANDSTGAALALFCCVSAAVHERQP